MNNHKIRKLLEGVRDGRVDLDSATQQLRRLPFEDIDFARIDLHRSIRHGSSEVIFCRGKTPDQVLEIIEVQKKHQQSVFATRADEGIFRRVHDVFPDLIYDEHSGTIGEVCLLDETHGKGNVLIVAAGTSDLSVAREAELTCRFLGSKARSIVDVGVCGLHRLLAEIKNLQEANVIIATAGMEGALPTVVGGLVDVPVIAVPTSVGYGASLGGISALLGMLNSCAANVTVVNIDNGFGAGYVASMMNRRMSRVNDDA
jgi:NCAIR mutase (PurE)-related protein